MVHKVNYDDWSTLHLLQLSMNQPPVTWVELINDMKEVELNWRSHSVQCLLLLASPHYHLDCFVVVDLLVMRVVLFEVVLMVVEVSCDNMDYMVSVVSTDGGLDQQLVV